MTVNVRTPEHRPTVVAGALSIAAGVLALALVGRTPAQRTALVVGIVGIALVAAGDAAWRRRSRVPGVALGVAGVVVAAGSLLLAVTLPQATVHRIELVPGIVGLFVLLAGLLPIRRGRERTLTTLGTGLLFVTVLTSGVVQGAPPTSLFLAGIATVVAWDAADHAISLGRQVGRRATTYRSEVVHVVASSLVGVGAFAIAFGVYRSTLPELSLAGFVGLLIAGLAFSFALYR